MRSWSMAAASRLCDSCMFWLVIVGICSVLFNQKWRILLTFSMLRQSSCLSIQLLLLRFVSVVVFVLFFVQIYFYFFIFLLSLLLSYDVLRLCVCVLKNWRRLHVTVNPYIAFAILNIKDIGEKIAKTHRVI